MFSFNYSCDQYAHIDYITLKVLCIPLYSKGQKLIFL